MDSTFLRSRRPQRNSKQKYSASVSWRIQCCTLLLNICVGVGLREEKNERERAKLVVFFLQSSQQTGHCIQLQYGHPVFFIARKCHQTTRTAFSSEPQRHGLRNAPNTVIVILFVEKDLCIIQHKGFAAGVGA